ncbi:GNAT family N-acetyltransferase [Enterococcus faecalis]|uniref:GNAT family N-acetyltransferase n=1 Tax=Enterococcus TaxID=1350 RepID=UPI000352B561|nr:GNAT family N-acetyltransferase [Enterococcus faecalis]EGO2842403.1 GNAT family N-acetyltransferase [Enterococcus faecalis]EGO6530748.1 GNAT family N-acetyltransferase [Enterococcus faecalis]EGS8239280.1 GNAT family N-acetyltransferase [Enterococcus faecalis]EJA1041389.1 GNAT family N-acetyltransferase [Enterococcus faecalis]EPI24572.1 acetyltransferase, GNAT family [Enterococcus faecalis]
MSNYTIIDLNQQPHLIPSAAQWFSQKWQIPAEAYQASMQEMLTSENHVPHWWFCLNKQQDIVAGVGVIDNDFHNRADLTPNLCALYVEPTFRHQGLAGILLTTVGDFLANSGFKKLYLLTDHTTFYERYDWEFLTMVTTEEQSCARIYQKQLRQ